MKIVFTGLPYFASKLVNELKAFDSANKYVFCNTYYSKKDQIRFLAHCLNADLIVSFNGVTSPSKSLDYAIKLNKKVLMQWQGSDVLAVSKDKKTGAFTDKYTKYSKNYTDALWLRAELSVLEIDCDILHFKHLSISDNSKAFEKMEALTYIGQGKEDFYGLPAIIKLAEANPTIVFNVIGTDGANSLEMENINYLGWVHQSKVQELLGACPIYIRLTEHDGYSLSILEAIANGNYVLWNNPHPNCIVVEKSSELLQRFEEVKAEVLTNNYNRAQNNIEWGKKNLNKSVVLTNYIKTLLEIVC